MKEQEVLSSPAVRAVLTEISSALDRFASTGEGWTIFIDKMNLSFRERQEIREFLGRGGLSVKLEGTAEPAEWLESAVSGVWFGVFYDQNRKPVLETIEIGAFPQVAAAQPEDVACGCENLRRRLTELANGE